MYTITTGSASGVALTALLDTGNVEKIYHFCSHASLEAWLTSSGRSDGLPCNTGTSPTPALQVPSQGAPISSSELTGLTDEQLLQRMREIVDEMSRRRAR